MGVIATGRPLQRLLVVLLDERRLAVVATRE